MTSGWKNKATELVTEHNRDGLGCVLDSPGTGGEETEVQSISNEFLEVKGKTLTGKQVLKWAWENRNLPALKEATVLYSWYDEVRDISLVGLGVLVEKAGV